MSESSPDHPRSLVPVQTETNKNQQSDKKRYSGRTVTALVAGGVALLPAALWPLEVAHFLNDASAGITAVATLAIAWFTFTLWDATNQARESAEATTGQTLDLMDAQRAALETLALATLKAAEASETSAIIAQRAWVTANPPILKLRSAYLLEAGDGLPPRIRFSLDNVGRSVAKITTSYLSDAVQTGELPGPMPVIPWNKADDILADIELAYGVPYEGNLPCRCITPADMGPPPGFEAELMAVMGRGQKVPGTGNYPNLRFHGSIYFVDEHGSPASVWISAICTPPSRYFTVENT